MAVPEGYAYLLKEPEVGERVYHVDHIPSKDSKVVRSGVVNGTHHDKEDNWPTTYSIDWDESNQEVDCHSYSSGVLIRKIEE